jgi:hypothetical protein
MLAYFLFIMFLSELFNPANIGIDLSLRPRRRKRYVKIFYGLSPGYDGSTDGIDDLFGAFQLFHVAGTVRPVLEPHAEAAASFQRHAGQGGIHDTFVADIAGRPFQIQAFHHLQVELERLGDGRRHSG